MKHFPGQLCLHCYGAGLHSTGLFFNPHSLKFVLPKTILGLLPLFDDRTLKDGLTVFCLVFIESISLLNPGSEHEEQNIFVCHSGTRGSIHHPCQWPNCNLA